MAIDTCTTKSVVKIPVKKFIDTDKNCEDSSQDDCIHVRYHDCEEVPFMSKYISRKKFTFLKLFHSSKKKTLLDFNCTLISRKKNCFAGIKLEEKEECVKEIKQECSKVPVQNCAEVPVEHSKVISNLVCELQPQRICEEFTNHVCQTIPKNETKELPTCNCMEETENVCFDVTFQKCEEIPATKLDTREVCVEKILEKEVPEPVLKKEVCHDEIEQKCFDVPEQTCENVPVIRPKTISKEICSY